MATQTKTKGFGQRGGETPTLAERLLSGKPLERAPRARDVPMVRPRQKPEFGRKDGAGDGRGAMRNPTKRNAGGVDKSRPNRNRGWMLWLTLTLALVAGWAALAAALNWPSPTMGGRQLWTDVRISGDWRVQCHAWTGHCRLLDGLDVRRHWGDEASTLAAMDAARAHGDIPANAPRAVVFVHGLGRSAHSFDALADDVRARGFMPVQFNYASTRFGIETHAHALNRVISGLDGVEEIAFVTHSLGAPVLRQALALNPDWTGRMTQTGTVMLAPPNQGSRVAAKLADNPFVRAVMGPALNDLAKRDAIAALPVPERFATVAGVRDPLGWMDARAGANDGLVAASETHLSGEAAHIEVAAAHTFIMNHDRVRAFVLDFIAHNG